MPVLFDWMSDKETLPKHHLMLAGLPGMGNVGKLVVDSLIEILDGECILRIIHPDLPPQAMLDDEGLLKPPHLSIHSIEVGGKILLTLSGEAQPLSPKGQFELASSLLELAADSGESLVLILAGMAAEPTSEEVFVICSDVDTRLELESKGVDVRRNQPEGGVIGFAGYLASLGPCKGVPSACMIATTFGKSIDAIAAERMRKSLSEWFDLELNIPDTATDKLIQKMEKLLGLEVAGAAESQILADDYTNSLYI